MHHFIVNIFTVNYLLYVYDILDVNFSSKLKVSAVFYLLETALCPRSPPLWILVLI